MARSLVVGVVTALAASAVWILIVFVLPIAVPVLVSRLPGSDAGTGGAVAYVDSNSVPLVALAGFVAGFWWQSRRSGKPGRER